METEIKDNEIPQAPPLSANQLYGQNMPEGSLFPSRCPLGIDCSAWEPSIGCLLGGCAEAGR